MDLLLHLHKVNPAPTLDLHVKSFGHQCWLVAQSNWKLGRRIAKLGVLFPLVKQSMERLKRGRRLLLRETKKGPATQIHTPTTSATCLSPFLHWGTLFWREIKKGLRFKDPHIAPFHFHSSAFRQITPSFENGFWEIKKGLIDFPRHSDPPTYLWCLFIPHQRGNQEWPLAPSHSPPPFLQITPAQVHSKHPPLTFPRFLFTSRR